MLPLILAAHLALAPVQDTAHIVLVATTDLHGHVTGRDMLTGRPAPDGMARVARVVDSLRARFPGQVVLVDAGDVLQGDPFATYFARVAPREPEPVIEAMNLAGYDAATPGDHDFDWGAPLLRRALSDARFAYVSANILSLPGDTPLLPAYRVVQRQGVRIGLSGFTTPGVMVWDREQVRGKLRVAPIGPAAQETLEAVRRDADLSIVLVHSGMDGRSSYPDSAFGGENVAARFAKVRPAPDLVVVGHSHRELRDSVIDGVHFVQPKPFGASVSIVHFVLTRDEGGPWKVRQVRAELVSTREVPPADLLTHRLVRAADSVTDWVRTPLGLAAGAMPAAAARARPTAIVNFINEVQRRSAHADVSATSLVDLHAGFNGDTVRVGDILSLYPDENTLRAVRITGAQLKAYLEWSARYFLVDPAGRVTINDSIPGSDYDIVGGASYDIDLRRPVGDRIVGLALRGAPLGPGDSLTMAVNSRRQSGAGGYDMLQSAPVVYDKGESIAELLMEEVRTRGPIDPADYASADWRVVPEVYSDAVRNIFGIAATPLPEGARDTVMLRVLATADLRARVLRGAAPAEATMDSLAKACACPALRLDAGDAMEGSPLAGETRGRAVLEVLNLMGYGAAALGDRDFDWSTDTVRRRMADAKYPWLAANVFDSVTGRRPDWIAPYRILPVGGMNIAVVGYVTPDVRGLLPDDHLRALRFGEGELAIHDILGEIASRKPALTVLIMHAGLACDSIDCTGEVVRLADQLERSGVDLVVAGHAGKAATTRVGGIPVMEAGANGSSVAVADLVKTPAGGFVVRTRIVAVDSLAQSRSPALLTAIEFYRRRSDSVDARPIAQLKRPLPRIGSQFALGGLLAEARRNVLRADVGLVRNEGIAADLPAGPVTYARLTSVEPERQDMVRVVVTGVQLRAALEHALDGGEPGAHVAGVQVRFDPKKPAGHRISRVVLQGNRKLKPAERYLLAIDAGTADGAGGYTMLVGLPRERRGMIDVEVDAGFLRRLPQPVEIGETAGFVSVRR